MIDELFALCLLYRLLFVKGYNVMNRTMSRLLVCALCLMIAFLVSLTTTTSPAHAASARLDSPAVSTHVENEAYSTRAFSVTRLTYCPSPLTQYVKFTLLGGAVNCFYGSGYQGYPIIQNVVLVQNFNGSRIWFVYYQTGKSGGTKEFLLNGGYVLFNVPAGITQVCLGC